MAFIEPMHRNKSNITYLHTLWGGIAVGVWMIFGVGHDTCVFSEIGFWSSLYVFRLGGRLLNPTKPLWAWTDTIIRHPHSQPLPQPKMIWTPWCNWKIYMANISDHGSSRWKYSTGCGWICSKKGNWWHGKWSSRKVKCLKSGSIFIIVDQKHQSQNLSRTTMLMNYYPVKVSPTKCVIQSRELNNMAEWNCKGTSITRCSCSKTNLREIWFICPDHRLTNNSRTHQYWLFESSHSTIYSKPSKMFSTPEIRSYQKFLQRKKLFALNVAEKDIL